MSSYVLLPQKKKEKPLVKLLTLEEFMHEDELKSNLEGELGLDFEANTYDYTASDFKVRTVGLANDKNTISIDLLGADNNTLNKFYVWLLQQPYVAHNTAMEAGTLLRVAGSVGKPICDTFVVFADLATEYNRPHRLQVAMEDLLGQAKEGDIVKDYMKANKWTWKDVDKFDFNILGQYNAIDAWGCWEIYKYFKELTNSFDSTWGQYYWDYHKEDCLNEVLLQVETRHHGIDVDTKELFAEFDSCTTAKDEALSEFINHSDIKPHIEAYNEEVINSIKESEPPKFTEKGKVTARYTKWVEKLEKAKNIIHFNTNSTQQLRWLFFTKMDLEPVEFTEKGEPSTSAACLAKMGQPGEMLLKYRRLVTRLKFLTQVKDGQTDGKIRPFVRPFATLTSRCGGGTLE